MDNDIDDKQQIAGTQRAYLNAMGITLWKERGFPAEGDALAEKQNLPTMQDTAKQHSNETSLPPTVETEPKIETAEINWDSLKACVKNCVQCELYKTRTQTVFGVGDEQADWMVIGEAPGAEEDRQGEPFVGKAGQLLNAMLKAIGLARNQVYIANILKCRPPGNRNPLPEEVGHCERYLKSQVELLNPKIILAFGRVAAQNLLKTQLSLARLRGKKLTFGDREIPVVVTYHPAYLLRTPVDKRKAWEDLKFAVAIMEQLDS